MKKILLFLAALAVGGWSAAAAPQKPVTMELEAHITGLTKDYPIILMLGSGNSYSGVAFDTLRRGHVKFTYTFTSGDPLPASFLLSWRSKELQDMRGQFFWTRGGLTTVKGDGLQITKWTFANSSPEEREFNELNRIASQYNTILEPIEEQYDLARKDKDRSAYDSLKNVRLQVYGLIYIAQHKYFLSRPSLTAAGLNKFASNVEFGCKYGQSLQPYMQEIRSIYAKLSPEQKKSASGATVDAILNPTKQLAVGDMLPLCAVLADTTGTSHTLAEFGGKYILIDVWSLGCGPCIAASNELRTLSTEYADSLTIVGVNVDGAQGWKRATRNHNITWTNLSDGKGQGAGFCANFDVRSIPLYVLADPTGRIISIDSGYGEGVIRDRLKKWLTDPKTVLNTSNN
ncbi:MAG: TlpA disulfide reductase family protein [Mucinivorans sp.]